MAEIEAERSPTILHRADRVRRWNSIVHPVGFQNKTPYANLQHNKAANINNKCTEQTDNKKI